MSYVPIFTYNGGADPVPDWIRILVSDTVEFATDGTTPIYIFSNQEIDAAIQIVRAQFQSGQFWSTPAGAVGGGTLGSYLPALPIPFYRVAGILLTALASNSARLASITQLLDVKLSPALASKALRDQAQAFMDADDNSGAFMIIEQVQAEMPFSFAGRFFRQWQRQSAPSA